MFESGLADDMTTWSEVIQQLTPEFEVFAYNRAGFSGSKSLNTERNGANIVKELNALLEKSKLTPPYILVGHSLGAGYLELYAKTFPYNVSAMVLVDPNSSKYPAACKREQLDYCDPPSSMPSWASLFFPAAVKGEINEFITTHSQINAIEAFPDIPLVVISAQKQLKNSSNKEIRAAELYTEMHKNLTLRVSESSHLTCDTCGHNIHQDKPELVVEGIKWVMQKMENKH